MFIFIFINFILQYLRRKNFVIFTVYSESFNKNTKFRFESNMASGTMTTMKDGCKSIKTSQKGNSSKGKSHLYPNGMAFYSQNGCKASILPKWSLKGSKMVLVMGLFLVTDYMFTTLLQVPCFDSWATVTLYACFKRLYWHRCFN